MGAPAVPAAGRRCGHRRRPGASPRGATARGKVLPPSRSQVRTRRAERRAVEAHRVVVDRLERDRSVLPGQPRRGVVVGEAALVRPVPAAEPGPAEGPVVAAVPQRPAVRPAVRHGRPRHRRPRGPDAADDVGVDQAVAVAQVQPGLVEQLVGGRPPAREGRPPRVAVRQPPRRVDRGQGGGPGDEGLDRLAVVGQQVRRPGRLRQDRARRVVPLALALHRAGGVQVDLAAPGGVEHRQPGERLGDRPGVERRVRLDRPTCAPGTA